MENVRVYMCMCIYIYMCICVCIVYIYIWYAYMCATNAWRVSRCIYLFFIAPKKTSRKIDFKLLGICSDKCIAWWLDDGFAPFYARPAPSPSLNPSALHEARKIRKDRSWAEQVIEIALGGSPHLQIATVWLITQMSISPLRCLKWGSPIYRWAVTSYN